MEKLKGGFFWTIIVLVIFLAGVGLLAFKGSDEAGQSGTVYDVPVSEVEQVKGNPEASVILVEYADFQCPACAFYAQIAEAVVSEFGQDMKLVYKHFPLRSIHANANLAAQAAEAAGIQGKFWEMHDALFANQRQWSDVSNPESLFMGYATTIGLDEEKFKNDMQAFQVKEKVQEDLDGADALGLNSTPTFILNDEKIQPRSLDEFRTLIQTAIENTQP